MKIRQERIAILVSVLFTLLLSFPVFAQDRVSIETSFARELPGTNPHALVGTWLVQTTITNCMGGTLESFSKLVSANAGGTLQETSSSTLFRSVALGVWEHRGQTEFVYAQRFFRFNPDGTPAGSVRGKWTVSMAEEGGSYTATGAIQIVAPNGTVVASPCGTETGTAMSIPE